MASIEHVKTGFAVVGVIAVATSALVVVKRILERRRDDRRVAEIARLQAYPCLPRPNPSHHPAPAPQCVARHVHAVHWRAWCVVVRHRAMWRPACACRGGSVDCARTARVTLTVTASRPRPLFAPLAPPARVCVP